MLFDVKPIMFLMNKYISPYFLRSQLVKTAQRTTRDLPHLLKTQVIITYSIDLSLKGKE